MQSGILYRDGEDYTEPDRESFFEDLRIDAVLAEITGEKYAEARVYFRRKPERREDVLFRLEIMADLERPALRDTIDAFITEYGQYRLYLKYSETLPQRETREKWLLDAACAYCGCLEDLRTGLIAAAPASEGLRRLLGQLEETITSADFMALCRDATACAERMNRVQYTMDIWLYQNRVALRMGVGDEADCSARFRETFKRYNLPESPRLTPFPGVNMESLELAILERLSGMYPDEFHALSGFCSRHPSWDASLADTFAAELQFYLAYIEYMNRLRKNGHVFAYPTFIEQKTVVIHEGYDLSLAQTEGAPVTPNDFIMERGECFIITGPNHGGKTTYARMVGQALHFASLGLPAPCDSIETYFIGRIATHFAREEDLSNNYGRLKEELQRTKSILDSLPPDSILLFNDLFSSTTTADALEVGGKLLQSLIRRGCVWLFVTYLHELAQADPHITCLTAAPDEDRKAFRVTRGTPGRAAANRLVAQYRLTYEDIRRRI